MTLATSRPIPNSRFYIGVHNPSSKITTRKFHLFPQHKCLDALEAENIVDHVIAVPVFISVSSHSERDIPNCLNTRFMPERDDEMRRYTGRLPITYTCGLDHGKVPVGWRESWTLLINLC